jgi:hypothetical protein
MATNADNKPGGALNPLPENTSVNEPKVVNSTLTAGAVVLAIITTAQILYDNADLIAFLPDALEAPLMAIVTAILTYSAGYMTRHQFRRNRAQSDQGMSAKRPGNPSGY